MKHLMFALLLVPFLAEARASDAVCVHLGKSSELFVKNRDSGVSEESLIAMYDSPEFVKTITKGTRETMKKVIGYVYTVRYDAARTRELVYLKCGLGHFE